VKTHILFIDSVHPCLKEELEKAGMICEEDFISPREVIESRIDKYDGIIIRSRFKLDNIFLSKTSRLKFIARLGAGMENIDEKYAKKKGIACLNAPEGNRDAVAEHVLGMLLSLFNNLCRADRQVRNGLWIREGNRGIELQGKTVGIIGYGNMGTAFAKRLQGFEVNVIAYDKFRKNYSDNFAKEASMDTIFEQVDILSLHIPLTEETKYLVNDPFIKNFRKNIYLINTSRGKIVNTADLVKHIESGKISGACLDVMEYESLSFENLSEKDLPAPFQYLVKSDRVILSPHIAGWTHESNEKLARVLAGKIKALGM
jgi:D-3-phosphoglycerate dehydrogenase / 2-oxoglutarate reductase